MKDLISVVVTCYNHEDYIEQCLRSIFKQNYRNIELFVFNDGSTDKSAQIIQETLRDSPFPTQFKSHENMGVVKTRNKGLSLIQGTFFLFVDSDNFLDENYIEKLYQKLCLEKADIAYSDLYDPDRHKIYLKSHPFDLSSFLERSYIDSCSLVRTEVAQGVVYDVELNYKKLEDYDFLLNLIINKQAVPIYVQDTKLNYRVLENSISQRNSTKYHFDVYLYVLKKYLDKIPQEVYQALSDNIFTLEGRLDDLIQHTAKVADYVSELKGELSTSKGTIETLKISVKKIKHQRDEAIEEQFEIRHSISYRLGNAMITPLKYIGQIIRNPRNIKGVLSLMKQQLIRLKRKAKSPKTYYYQLLRNSQRKQIANLNGKKVLIYVIFESERRLQQYKILFLEKLAVLADETLIVVNGGVLAEDIKILEKYGQVLTRDNIGYDTAAFREGILSLGKDKLQQYSQLMLVNDTNIGPMRDLTAVFQSMIEKNLDFWGISYGETQEDITGFNKYGYIPEHLQSYFLVIEPLLLRSEAFYNYWEQLTDTDSRDEAIGKHETIFTKHFADLGYRYDALVHENKDSAMYIHPLKMLEAGSPLVKYTALRNYDDQQFLWQGLERESEIGDLLEYIQEKTDYPVDILENIIKKFKEIPRNQYILIIDGVENIIPQCTRYRVLNKAEQLRKNGFAVKVVNASEFQVSQAQYASHIIIYRASWSIQLQLLCDLAKSENKPVYFDIDDLVFDTVYTDQLSYTQGLSEKEKGNYDAGVRNYGKMLAACDGAITSTNQLKEELLKYQDIVLLNRNLASSELMEVSSCFIKDYNQQSQQVKIGYFSGSISHNENFELIKPALKKLLEAYPFIELHIVGHLDIPTDMKVYEQQIIVHDYVDWKTLPQLISQVDINLAPLVDSIFNRAKSEIKWLEAAMVKVPTIASDIGAFADMVIDGQTGLLAKEDEWNEKLDSLIFSAELRQKLAENAYHFVLENCSLDNKDEMVTYFEKNKNNKS
ncbi:rhamnan synthesis F family protein [Streptococcus constellatus]|uniref:Glycosyltransferase, group 2 family protein n=1 Tax=Streptococcus constellatus subsp. constellatus SK53 TaxID=1095730 RepID=A0AAD2Y3R5_STRCV|nr:rhamnan synthesis F family protein [Streptococcus constellatus]EID18506.1 glycosyltransferase, group 2 family protein [Streptococcus constellatus subsp. constellatus SK53]MDP1485130.1 rhamnan synthesis F family protein [Streptococcus constellatus]QQT06133.1 glycosyltransferase [Streptococcus constellatus]SUN40715.1 putative glycosyltransferase [Streptococcus constellatus]BBD22796.1 glycosyl transferase [Streptococcus constellatus subsp. constellatus]